MGAGAVIDGGGMTLGAGVVVAGVGVGLVGATGACDGGAEEAAGIVVGAGEGLAAGTD